mmetsp:Transcript_47498/g.148609  ORF Transcript_47498/g.148609 Transcript_47498/m.148609 type:complete len:654 (-) Transcript_47498:28-1989(-)
MVKIHGEHVASIPHIAAVISPGLGEKWANLVVILCQLGTCIAYNIFLGVSFTAIVEELYPTHNYAEMQTRGYNPYVFFVLCNTMLFCLLVQFKDFARMAPLLIFAQGAMMTAMALVIAHGLVHPSVCDRDADTQVFCRVHWEARWQTFPIFVGIAVFAMEGIPTILAIEDSLERPELFERMFDITQTLVTVVFIGFGVMGYWLYGDNTRSVITLNIHGLWGISVKMLMVVVIFFSYPLQFFPVAQIFSKVAQKFAASPMARRWSTVLGLSGSEVGGGAGEVGAGASKDGEADVEISDRLLSIFKVLGVLVTGLIALCVPHFGHVLSILGSVTFSAITYLIPPILYLKARQGSHHFQMVLLSFLLILFGLSVTAVGLWSNFMGADVWKHEIEKAPPRAGSSEALQAHHIYKQAEGLIKKSSAEANKLEEEERSKWNMGRKGKLENSWTKKPEEAWKRKWIPHPEVPVNKLNQDKTFYKTAESVGTMEGLVKEKQWKKFVPWPKSSVLHPASNTSKSSLRFPPPPSPLPSPHASHVSSHPSNAATRPPTKQRSHWSNADSYAIRRLQKTWKTKNAPAVLSPSSSTSSHTQGSSRKSIAPPPPLSGKGWQVPKLIFHRHGASKTREQQKKDALRKLLRMKADSNSRNTQTIARHGI